MKYSVIPQPKSFIISSETSAFELFNNTEVLCPEDLSVAKDELQNFIKENMSLSKKGKSVIEFSLCENLHKEGYKISVKNCKTIILASTKIGAFYAVQSLKQLFLQNAGVLYELEIDDEPEIEYRAFMFDSSRYFFEKKHILTFLDIMALHKLNTFHWHITDDQGWRLESEIKPLLTKIGSFRKGTNFCPKSHGGYYSKKDILEITEYARKKFITIIPEIDSPGHIVSAIASYPELSCFNRKLPVATHSGVKHDVLCVGKESTYDFIFSVWDEAIELFGASIIHLGGDEVPSMRWEICPDCRKIMKENNFTDAKMLHSYYINRLSKHLQDKGIKTIMWTLNENIGSYNDDIIQEYWGGIKEFSDFAEKTGEKNIINACSSAYYFDLPYGTVSLKDTYLTNPLSSEKVLGVECCLWTEYVPDMKRAFELMFPRMSAFSEKAWNTSNNLSYEKYYEKLSSYCDMLTRFGYGFTKPEAANPKKLKGKLEVLWFERRQLHWQGLHNILDDRKVKRENSY